MRATAKLLGMMILVQLFLSPAWGLKPDKSVDQYLVDHWEMPGDIPSNLIHAIAQTPNGYLWFATNKGLVRFDGIKFNIIHFVNKEEIQPQQATLPDTLFVDRNGNLWIGSSGGLTIYDYRTSRFKTFSASQGLTQDRIRHINEDMEGNLWITFYSNYVDRFSNGKFTHFNASHGLYGNKINAVVENSSGNLLFATREKGIFIYRDGKFFKYPIPGLKDHYITSMYDDRKGELWIGTSKGLFRVTGKSAIMYTTAYGLSNNYITTILEDSNHNLWIGTKKGLNRLKKNLDGTVLFESLLKPFIIVSLLEDREGSLWVGTYDSGIMRLKDRKFATYAPLEAFPEEVLSSLFLDRQGDIWIGTSSGELFHCRGSFIETIDPPELSGTGILAIAEDAEGNLWLGTMSRGIYQKKNGIFEQLTTVDGLSDNMVTSIYRDSRDNLWFSTFDGVSILRYPDSGIESFKFQDGLLGRIVNNIYEDKDHNIWIAADQGITVLKYGKIAKQNATFYLQGISVTCIYEDLTVPDSEGQIYWIATHGAGLKRLSLKDNKIISYTTANGMATDFIYQFFEDREDNFWLTSNSGILRVSKTMLNRFASGVVDNIHCTSFGKADGMKSSEFNNEFSRNSVLKAGNGELWFLTKKGISIVDPERIRINKLPPPVVIEAVFMDGQSIPLNMDTGLYKFKGISNLEFHFTAPTFLSPEKVKFRYRLEGFDTKWNFLPPGRGRIVSYVNIPVGTYTFRVIASNAEGVWNRTGDSITFTLKPFFHQTVIFKILIMLLLIILVTVFFYIFKKRPLTIVAASAVNYLEQYLHRLLTRLSKSSEKPIHPDIKRIPRFNILSNLIRRIEGVLAGRFIPGSQSDQVIDFLKESSPDVICRYLVNRLGADCQPAISSFKLFLGKDFILNMDKCLAVFPPEKMQAAEILDQAKKIVGASYQVCLVFSTSEEQQSELRKYTQDTANSLVTPDSKELSDLLLSPSPLDELASLISSQVKMTRLSPYQTTQGVNKESVFFGREQLLAHIMQREPSNYILMGGRQIGKSSLLKAIDRRYKDDSSTECHYLVLEGLNITGKLASAMKLPEDIDLSKLLSHMGDIEKGKRRLFLIDEADKFIEHEQKTGYSTLHHFRSLSEEGGCYFILSGFWGLFYAAAFDYQSPIKNFGEPLTVEALEPDACRQLAVKPMARLNIHYESEELIDTIVHETGRRANLIAIACDEMLKKLDMSERIIRRRNLETALDSNAMHNAFRAWGQLTSDKKSNRLDRIIVYATIDKESFSQEELMRILEFNKCNCEPEEIKKSLARMELAFILERKKQFYSYRVPLFKNMILEQNPVALLESELKFPLQK